METAYEAIFIIETGLPDEQFKIVLDKYSDVVTKSGGIVDDIDRWETRRLAYEIKGRREGIYITMNFRGEPPVKNELERIFGISDDILRSMIIKQDRRADRFPSQSRAAEFERREREMAARMASMPQAQPMPPQEVTDLPTPGSGMEPNGEISEAVVPVSDIYTPDLSVGAPTEDSMVAPQIEPQDEAREATPVDASNASEIGANVEENH